MPCHSCLWMVLSLSWNAPLVTLLVTLRSRSFTPLTSSAICRSMKNSLFREKQFEFNAINSAPHVLNHCDTAAFLKKAKHTFFFYLFFVLLSVFCFGHVYHQLGQLNWCCKQLVICFHYVSFNVCLPLPRELRQQTEISSLRVSILCW